MQNSAWYVLYVRTVAAGLIRYRLGLRLVLVGDVELDRTHRPIGEVLVAVNRAARDVDAVSRFQHTRRLTLYGESDLAFLHRPPLVAGMGVKLIARAGGNHHRLQP